MKDPTCHRIEELIVESASAELSAADRELVTTHLASCESCAAFAASVRNVISGVRESPHVDPGEVYWDRYYGRLLDRMEQRGNAVAPTGASTLERLRAAFTPRYTIPAAVRQAFVAVILVGIGVVIGRLALTEPTEAPIEPMAQVDLSAAATRAQAYDYIARSKTLLIGLANFDPRDEDPALLNLPRRQEIAARLVSEAGTLKSDLGAADQHRLEELIRDLELILMQIANIEENHDIPEIEILQSGLDRSGVLFRINVEEMRRDEPERESASAESANRNSLSL